MKFWTVFLVVVWLGAGAGRAEILLKTPAGGTAMVVEVAPDANIEIQLRVALADGGESIRSDAESGGSTAAEGASVEVKRNLVFGTGEEVLVERGATVEGGSVRFQEKWQGALLKGGVYLNLFLPFQDFVDAKVEFLEANGEEVAPTAALVAGETGTVRGLRCGALKISGWKGKDLTFRFETPVDCYVYSRKNGVTELVDIRMLIQRSGVTTSSLDWSLAVVEAGAK